MIIQTQHQFWLHLHRTQPHDQDWCIVGEPLCDELEKMSQWRTTHTGYKPGCSVIYIAHREPTGKHIAEVAKKLRGDALLCGTTTDFEALQAQCDHKLNWEPTNPRIWWIQIQGETDEQVSKTASRKKASKAETEEQEVQSSTATDYTDEQPVTGHGDHTVDDK